MKTNPQYIIELYNNGFTYKQIETRLKISTTIIRKVLLQFCIQPRPRGPKPSSYVREACKEARQLRAAGLTFKEIGEQLAVSRQRAYQLYQMESPNVS